MRKETNISTEKPKIGIDKQDRIVYNTGMKNKDIEYANRYFSNAPSSMRETMVKIINKAVPTGQVCVFADIGNKEKLSAYRVVAHEMGIQLGDWLIRNHAGTAIAKINCFTGIYFRNN